MENKIKYTAIVLVAVLVIAVFVYQQKKLGDLSGKVNNMDSAEIKNQQNDAADSHFFAEAIQKNIADNTNELQGTLVSKIQGSITVEASVVDLSKLSGLPDDALQNQDSLPKKNQQFVVKVNDNTEMPIKLNGIKIGSNVDVFTGNSIYGGGELIASKVWVLPSSSANTSSASDADFLNNALYIGGVIKEMGSNYYVVEVQWVNAPKPGDSQNIDPATAPKTFKTYKVLIDDKTVFVNNNKNALKVGDDIDAYAGKPTFTLSEFTATKIEGPFLAPGK